MLTKSLEDDLMKQSSHQSSHINERLFLVDAELKRMLGTDVHMTRPKTTKQR